MNKERRSLDRRLFNSAAWKPPLLGLFLLAVDSPHERTPVLQPIRGNQAYGKSIASLAAGRRSLFRYVSARRRPAITAARPMGRRTRHLVKTSSEPWSPETEQEYHKHFSGAIERWLDAGHGSCVLRRRDCAELLAATLRHFDGERLALISSIVMPNHVHALFVQNPEHPLEKLLRSWKTFTARRINDLLGRSGSLWQRDHFDRLVRDENHFANCVRYIRRNPEKACLGEGEFILYESTTAKRID